ncbi:MAG: undecaprenyl-diphosphate phosphatase [Actinomycetota bacterium]
MREIILGIVQGLTEFLPISSSGHLVLVPRMLGWDEPELGLTVMLHLGTLVALLIYFRNDIIGLTLGVLGRGPDPAAARRITRFLIVGTIPAVIAGLALGGFFEDAFHRPYESSIELVFTGLILIGTERFGERANRRELDDPRAFGIGAAQALAILPGLSRSGATIGAGLLAGLSREEATRFSFLLSIPAIAGAAVLDAAEGELVVTGASIAGTLAAGIVGFLSIHYLLRFVRTHSLTVFCWYIFLFAPLSALVVWLR